MGSAVAKTRFGRRRWALAGMGAVLAALAGAGVYLHLHRAAGPRSWLGAGLSSGLSLTCLAIAGGCLAALVGIGALMWRIGRRHPRPAADSGSAMVEFALVLPLALSIALVMFQSMMLMAGNLCVHYAAYCAARSAIVAIPDGPRPVDWENAPGREPQNVIADNHYSGTRGQSEKCERMWRAAVWGVLPISSSSSRLPPADSGALESGLSKFFSAYGEDTPHWVTSVFGRKLRYAQDYTAIDVSPPANGLEFRANEDVTVRVEHTVYLAIPYANWLFANLFDDGRELGFGDGEYGVVVDAEYTLTNEGVQDFVEMESYEDYVDW